MEKFTGEAPGYFTKKMFVEKAQSLERSRKSQKNPNNNRRSKHVQKEKDTDYGEAAVEAAEITALEQSVVDVETMRQKYQVMQQQEKHRHVNDTFTFLTNTIC